MLLAHDLLGAPLPAPSQARLRAHPVVRVLAREVQERIFAEEEAPPGMLLIRRFHLRARERMRDKARYLFFGLTPPRQRIGPSLRSRRRFRFFYYLLRPIRIFRDALLDGPPKR